MFSRLKYLFKGIASKNILTTRFFNPSKNPGFKRLKCAFKVTALGKLLTTSFILFINPLKVPISLTKIYALDHGFYTCGEVPYCY